MKSKYLNFSLNFSTSTLLACMVLFLLGTVLITSPAYTETPTTNKVDAEKSDKSDDADTPDKPEKPDKPNKNAAEDFGDGNGDKPGEKDGPDGEVEAEHPVIPELENEAYIELARIGKLNDKQQKLLVKVQKKRKKALEHWDRTTGKKLEETRRKSAEKQTDSRHKTLRKRIAKLEAQREKLGAGFDMQARRVCKSPQLIDYNAKLLYRAAMDDFDGMQIQLSDEEILKVKEACATVAKSKFRSPAVDLNRDKKTQSKGVYLVAKKALTKPQLKRFKRTKMQEEREKREREKNKYRR